MNRREFVKGSLALAGVVALGNIGRAEEGTKKMNKKCVVVYPNLTNKKLYLLLTMAETNRKMFDGVLAAMRGFLACYEGSKECGMVCASGVYEKGTVKGTKFMSAARKLGMKVK